MKKLLKFSSPFCQPCQQMTKNLAQIDHDWVVEEINILDNMEVAIQYGIRGVPVILKLNENGQEVSRLLGLQSVEHLSAYLGGKTITEVIDSQNNGTLLG